MWIKGCGALISPTAYCGLANLNRDLLETDIISSRPTHSHKAHLGSKQTHTPLEKAYAVDQLQISL